MPIEQPAYPGSKKLPFSWFLVVLLSLLIAASAIIIYVPQYQVSLLRQRVEATSLVDANERKQLEKDYVDYANKARATLAQIIGGIFVLGTIGVALWNAKIAQDNARAALQNAQAAQTNAETAQKNLKLAEETSQKNLQLAEDSKLTERFAKAIELLGNDELNVRLGAIYALERVAWDSQRDHWPVMEVLTAFIREVSPIAFQKYQEKTYQARLNDSDAAKRLREYKIPTDIQAAISVIGRRNPKWIEQETDKQYLDFRGSILRNAKFSFAILNNGVFFNTDLSDAEFYKTELKNARFLQAVLRFTSFREANISGADFYFAENLFPEVLLGAIRDEKTLFDPALKAQLEALEVEQETSLSQFKQLLEQGSKATLK